jgi:predicted ATPase
MSHPFGDLIRQHLHRKQGLSQTKLANGILQMPSVITAMCKGQRLTGPQARERVVAIIRWLQGQGALATLEEANLLLNAAGLSPLHDRTPAEAVLIQTLHPQPQATEDTPHPGSSLSSLLSRRMPRYNLPTQLTRFIGREHQIVQLAHQVQATRLLTLTGAGGVGKTRLALEVGAQVVDAFANGVWFVDLASVVDPALVAPAVTAVFQLPERSDRTHLEMALAYLTAKHLLLILDNCEHLIDTCASLIEHLLRGCPHLSVLATSREVLRIGGETAWRVPSLTRPNFGGSETGRAAAPLLFTPETILQYEAVRLFLERLGKVQANFALTAHNAAAIAEICSRLDGIPLALEMAAAQATAMTVEEMARQLASVLGTPFQWLITGTRTAPARHRTLRATLAWSYALLTPLEQTLLARLSVFAGGWTAEAAQTICAASEDDDLPPGCVLPLLTQLVDKSLVIADKSGGQTRYRLLETIRQFGVEKLREQKQAERMRAHHFHYFLAIAEQSYGKLRRRAKPLFAAAVKVLEAERDNLRAALTWAREQADAGELLLWLTGALGVFWVERGHQREGTAWLEAALERGQAAPVAARARAMLGLAALSFMADTQRMAALAEESLALCQAANDPYGIAYSLGLLGEVARRRLDYARAQALLEQTLQLSKAGGAEDFGLFARLSLANVLTESGQPVQAAMYFAEAVQLANEIGDAGIIFYSLHSLSISDHPRAMALCEQALAHQRAGSDPEGLATLLHICGRLCLDIGAYERAQRALGEALAIWQERNIQMSLSGGTARVLYDLGRVAWLVGDLERATQHFAESLSLLREADSNEWAEMVLIYTGYIALAQDDIKRAAACFRECLTLWQIAGDPSFLPIMLAGMAEVAKVQKKPQRAGQLFGAAVQFEELTTYGRPPSERIDYERFVAAARSQLADPTFAAAWAEGQAMTLEQAVALAKEERDNEMSTDLRHKDADRIYPLIAAI